MSRRIFVSYSRHDAPLVTPVVRLLRAAKDATKDMVFLDADSIEPGRRWRSEIEEALVNASLVVVFWCRHSSASKEVAEEYKAALQAGKALLPVLLDSTSMPRDLGEFQWIDFRELATEYHAAAEPAARPGFSLLPIGGAVLASLALVVGASVFWLTRTDEAGTVAPEGTGPLWLWFAGIAVVLAIVAWWMRVVRRRADANRPAVGFPREPTPSQHYDRAEVHAWQTMERMSDDLIAEIRRRVGTDGD